LESEFVVGLGFEFEFGVELGLESGFLLQLIYVCCDFAVFACVNGSCSFCEEENCIYLVFAVFAVNLMQQPRSAQWGAVLLTVQ
jgi:hypothetical protein